MTAPDLSLSSLPARPIAVLVAPQMGENIGAAARAMLNCGWDRLRLVNPRDGWPNERAEAMSCGAFDLMPPVEVFGTLEEALADCHTVFATTARARDLVKPVMTARSAAHLMHQKVACGENVAVLFGAERSGLSNAEISLAHILVTIPLNPGFSSLNLGQSVLLLAYEWSQSVFSSPELALPMRRDGKPATNNEFFIFFKRLVSELEKTDFFRSDEKKENVIRNINALFLRIQPTNHEIKLLHGIISSFLEIARGRGHEL